MPDAIAFLPLRREAPAVAKYDLPCVRRGAASAPLGDTGQRVDLRAQATPGTSHEGFFKGSRHNPPVRSDRSDLTRAREDSRRAMAGFALTAAAALLLATGLLTFWLELLAEAIAR